MAHEQWLPIEGYLGYEVSDHGRVRSLDRENIYTNKRGTTVVRTIRGVVMATVRVENRCGNEYEKAIFTVKGKSVSRFVHRLVAQAFMPTNDIGKQVNHKDGNTLNNVLSNLEWVTQSENMRHAVVVLGFKPHGRPIQVGAVRYESIAQAARDIPVAVSHLRNVLNGRKHTVRGMRAHYVSRP